jgi:hypothetical protein
MTGQISGCGGRDLPVPALMQVGGAHVRMIQHRPVIPKRINITGHEPELFFTYPTPQGMVPACISGSRDDHLPVFRQISASFCRIVEHKT